MVQEKDKYLFVFASSYHAYYAEELLRRHSIKSTLRKAPRAIARSCYSSLYIKEEDLEKSVKLLQKSTIRTEGAYEILRVDKLLDYKKLKISFK